MLPILYFFIYLLFFYYSYRTIQINRAGSPNIIIVFCLNLIIGFFNSFIVVEIFDITKYEKRVESIMLCMLPVLFILFLTVVKMNNSYESLKKMKIKREMF